MAQTTHTAPTPTPTPDSTEQHLPGKLFRSRRERIGAAVVFVSLTTVALAGRPLFEYLAR